MYIYINGKVIYNFLCINMEFIFIDKYFNKRIYIYIN